MFTSKLLAAILVAVSAFPNVSGFHVVHASRDAAPHGFVRRGPAESTATVDLEVVLPHTNIAGLRDELDAISNPGNPRYGEKMTKEQVEVHMRPDPESATEVKRWLSANDINIREISVYGDHYRVFTTVKRAAALLDTHFDHFEHVETGYIVTRALEYSVPDHIRRHINFIDGVVSFPDMAARPSAMLPPVGLKAPTLDRRTLPTSCTGTWATAKCIQDYYGLPTAPITHTSMGNSIGVIGRNNNNPLWADVNKFLSDFRPDWTTPPSPHPFQTVTMNGGTVDHSANTTTGSEPTADLEFTVGLATGVPVTFYQVGNNNYPPNGSPWMAMLDYFGNMTSPPRFVSVSYASAESVYGQAQATELCDHMMAQAGRGTSFFWSSGDSGAYQPDSSCGTLMTAFPPSCPYVVAVGWTDLTDPGSQTATIGSTGGFSNYFARQYWQDPSAQAYLNGTTPPPGTGSTTGRGTPDVTAIGYTKYTINGTTMNFAGSSIATPIMASTFSLIEDALNGSNKTMPGWLHPTIYRTSVRSAFNDVTMGNNGKGCTSGWGAKAGWDPVSGIGSPRFSNLVSAILAVL